MRKEEPERDPREARIEALESCLEKLIAWNYGRDGNENPVRFLKEIVVEAEGLMEEGNR